MENLQQLKMEQEPQLVEFFWQHTVFTKLENSFTNTFAQRIVTQTFIHHFQSFCSFKQNLPLGSAGKFPSFFWILPSHR